MKPKRNGALWLALACMLGIQLVTWYRLQGPLPRPADAPLAEFSARRAFAVLERLLDDQAPHPTGSRENSLVRERLVAELNRLGLEAEIQQFARGPKVERTLYNVLARLPNTTSLGRPLVLATHYDSVPQGPGAADAGSCVAALLETARALRRGGPYKRPVYFLFTDGEEAGLLGAAAFVGVHPLSAEKPFVLNFEARGTSGASLMFETHRGNLSAVRFVARHLPAPCATGSSYVTVYRLLPNDTDFTIFQRDDWTGLNFAFIGDAYRYHTDQDTLQNLSLRSLQHHGENALALSDAIARDTEVNLLASAEDAVFFDLLGYTVVCYPQSWALRLAMIPLVVLVLRFAGPLFTRSSFRVALLLAAIVLVALAASAALGAILARGLMATWILPRSHVALGGLISTLYVPISVALVWFLGRRFLHVLRGTAWSVFWVGWAIMAVVLAMTLPGFSYFALVPASAAAVVSLLPIGTQGRMFFTVAVSSVMLLPLASQLPVALGPRAGLVLCPVFTLVLLPLLPFLASGDTDENGARRVESLADMPSDAR